MTLGGAEVLLANSLSKGGLNEFTDNWLVFLQKGSDLLDRVDKNVKVIDLKYKGFFDLPRTLFELRKIIKENKIDILHSHLTPAGLYAQLSCPKMIPHIHSLHAPYSMNTETNRKMLFLERYLYLKNKSTKVICLTEFTRADFIKAINFTGESFVLNNFVADAFFSHKPKIYQNSGRSLKIAGSGTLKKLKNFEYLLEVFTYLKNYNITLDIYGSGDTTEYENYITTNGIKVCMKGCRTDMENALEYYDIFAVPSIFESFSLSGFEAMAAGLPLMVSDIEPLKNIMKSNAIYFPLNNALATAQIIIDIYNGITNVNELAQKGHEYALKTVKREAHIKELLSIYNQIL